MMFLTAAGNNWTDIISKLRDQIWNWIADEELMYSIMTSVLKILAILLVSRILIRILNRAIDHTMSEKKRKRIQVDLRRIRTIGRLAKNIISYTINFIVILMILSELKIELAPLIAGAGVLGLAVGFGAQNLIKDVISGFFIIFEDQFGVGDVIQTGSYKGTVELIGLRTTRLRSWTGEVHIIPNGSIVQVTNYSIHNAIAVVDFNFPYPNELEPLLERIESVVKPLKDRDSNLTGEPEVLGVQKVTPAEIVVRIIAECKPNTDAEVSRLINSELKRVLDEIQLQRIN
jgi:small conductance mechanosensitive channel